jgi:hypothetical protein
MSVSLGPEVFRITSLTAPPAPQLAGRTIRWACTASGADAILYAFDVYNSSSVRVGGAAFSAAKTFLWTPKAAGIYRIRASAKSGAAVITRYSSLYAINANVNRPVIKANGGKLASGGVSRYSITVAASDADPGDALKLTCTKDGKAMAWPAQGLFTASGLYRVAATDLVGHSSSLTFTIDRVKPTIVAKDPSGIAVANGGITRRSVKVSVSDKTLLSRTVTKNGTAAKWPSANTFTSHGDYAVTAKDKAGNVSVFRFTIDYTPPVITVKRGTVCIKSGQTVTGTVVAAVTDKHLKSYSAQRGGVKTAWPTGGRFSTAGSYLITAWDKAGNRKAFTFIIKPRAAAVRYRVIPVMAARYVNQLPSIGASASCRAA